MHLLVYRSNDAILSGLLNGPQGKVMVKASLGTHAEQYA